MNGQSIIENIYQVSMIEYPQLVGTATISIDVPPDQIAKLISGCKTERSFDNFDYFDFLALAIGDGRIAFRKYIGNPIPYSYVSIMNISQEKAQGILKMLLKDEDLKIYALNGEW